MSNTSNANKIIDLKSNTQIENIKMTEKALLSAILIDNSSINFVDLAPGDFYDTVNSKIFSAMLGLNKGNKPVDIVTVVDFLRDDANFDYVGYLASLFEMPGGLFNPQQYAKIIKKASVKRQQLSLVEDCKADKISIMELIVRLENLIADSGFESASNLPAIKIEQENIFGFAVEYGSICILSGATSAGKTEFMTGIADVFGKYENHIAIECFFERSTQSAINRFNRKNINNPNIYFKVKPSFKEIQSIVNGNNNKKILLIIDYLQMFALKLRAESIKPSEDLRTYTDQIYQFFDGLRIKNPNNLCICFISSFSNAGIGENRTNSLPDQITIMKALKEDGNIAYNADYGYSLFFADQNEKRENKWFLGKKTLGKMRQYTLLYPFKDSGNNGELDSYIYTFNAETRNHEMLIKEKENNISTNKQEQEKQCEIWA